MFSTYLNVTPNFYRAKRIYATRIFSRAYEPSSQRLCDSFGCKVCLREHKFTYLFTYLLLHSADYAVTKCPSVRPSV